VTENQTGLAKETARAMRELASTVTDAPPLRLTAPRDASAPRRSSPGRWTQWAVPLAAAVVVIALAVVLVVVRDLPGSRAPRPSGPTYPSAVAVPAYYVVPEQTCSVDCGPTRLAVGDTFTGTRLAALSPPLGSTFMAVSAAADDRTFVADTVRYSVVMASPEQATWYRITLSPGSSSPATVTRLPIPAGPAGAGVQAIALSASGRELAVTYHLGSLARGSAKPGTAVLRIYSMATGRLLHSWSTDWQNLFGNDPYTPGVQFNNQLSWVDGDHGIAFASTPPLENEAGGGAGLYYTALRVLNVAAGGSDLIADSRVVWPPWSMGTLHALVVCGWQPAPALAANGKTVMCVFAGVDTTGSGAARRATVTMTWQGIQTSDPDTARVLYQVRASTVGKQTGGVDMGLLWANASASTLIVAWTVDNADDAATQFGIVRDGRFTPLPPLPAQGSYRLFAESPGIAW
jgi:hypothetical protein